ncbi:MAG: phosphatidate cytidylyltransferase, partial [Sinobacteraceae bacterium]|nr:phosphatidate cytidylyltransferase [Nevskiaceae bacterium]
MNETLRKRIITAVILGLALAIIILFLPAIATVIALTLSVLAGAWEWSAFLRVSSTAWRAGYVAALAALMIVVWQLASTPGGRHLVLTAALVWWMGALVWVALAPQRVSPWSAALAGAMALLPAWLALVYMRAQMAHGAQWIMFTLLLVFAADIGAFFAGHRFGRLRLAPHVSPGKTWEGVLGGAAAGALVALVGGVWFGLPLGTFVPLCIAIVGLSNDGNLTESLLKRFAGLKDSGTLFPG